MLVFLTLNLHFPLWSRNSVNKEFLRLSETKLLVDHEGYVTWYAPMISTSSCRVNVRYFPFDTQKCNLSFSSWVYTMDQMELYLSNKTEATQVGLWEGKGWEGRQKERSRMSVLCVCICARVCVRERKRGERKKKEERSLWALKFETGDNYY